MIEVKKISKKFITKNNEFNAVLDISFCANPGEILALIGPNGAGKTTTVKMISNYLTPTSGEILIDNIELNQRNIKKLNIGVVFGGDTGFYNNATAYDNLVFFAALKKVPRKRIKSEIALVLEMVELSDVANKLVGEFSRGMKQRLHIARALLNNPNIILLDEPTTGLDVEIAYEIRKLILKLKEQNKTIVLTSHKMDEIERLADKIVVIGSGKVFFDGKINEFYDLCVKEYDKEYSNLEDAYLDYANKLKRVLI